MNQIEEQPAYRTVWLLLIAITIALSVFWAPPDVFGMACSEPTQFGANFNGIDGLGVSDKCLTQNQKALNCDRLEVVNPTGSESPIYSHCVSLKTDISRP